MATETKSSKIPPLWQKRSTFLLIPNDIHEDRIARHYLEQMCGEDFVSGRNKDSARIVQAIPLARLTDDSHVIVIARRKFAPVVRRQPDATGMPQEYPIAIEELMAAIKERDPVAVGSCWLDDVETGGKINMPKFLEQLNDRAQPFAVRQRVVPDEGPQIFLFHL